MTETEKVEIPRDHYLNLRHIVETVPPVVDDLMSEATVNGVVQDWGAVNKLLCEAKKAKARASELEVA